MHSFVVGEGSVVEKADRGRRLRHGRLIAVCVTHLGVRDLALCMLKMVLLYWTVSGYDLLLLAIANEHGIDYAVFDQIIIALVIFWAYRLLKHQMLGHSSCTRCGGRARTLH